mgnify:FL=1
MDQNKSQHISIELPYYDRKSLQEIEGQDLEVIFAKYANDEYKKIFEEIINRKYKYTLALSNSFGDCAACAAGLNLDLYYKTI